MKKIVTLLTVIMLLALSQTVVFADETNETEVVNGWFQDEEGAVYYYDENHELYTGLHKIDGEKYFFDEEGKIVTGKKKVGEFVYYFRTKGDLGKYGSARKGWVTIDKSCYFFSLKTCRLQKNRIIDGYKLDKKGRSQTRYMVRKLVRKHTNDGMSKGQKIYHLYYFLVNNNWTYTRTYEHNDASWRWYKGWTDDFAYQLMDNKSGNCFRYAALFGYMVKEATGYDVRVYHGKTPGSHGPVPHGWTTVKIKGKWYAFDPDMAKFHTDSEIYYKQLYSKTKKTIHLQGKYSPLQ